MKNAALSGLLSACLLLICSATLPAQDLTGIWRGHFSSNGLFERMNGGDDRYRMEVQIAQTMHSFEAVTYSYKSTEFYGKATAEGRIDKNTGAVVLKELKLVELRSYGYGACVMTCHFTYSRLGNEEFLQGTYSSSSTVGGDSGCGNGSIYLHKVVSSDFYTEPFLEEKERELAKKGKQPPAPEKRKLVKPVIPPPVNPPAVAKKKPLVQQPAIVRSAPKKKPVTIPEANHKSVVMIPEKRVNVTDSIKTDRHPMPATIAPPQISTRANEVVRSITVTHQDITLSIYDDGAIDNDSVTVYYDNQRILSRARLTDQAITLHVHVEASDEPHELVMVAENLGEIPPNTSLMVVHDGDQRTEVRIVTNEQKNAVLKIRYRKPE